MIQRIVKMTFRVECIDAFKSIFEEVKPKIEGMPGCHSVILLQEVEQPQIIFTYSVWEKAEDLEAYRNTLFFEATWKRTKKLFSGKAEAWSTQITG